MSIYGNLKSARLPRSYGPGKRTGDNQKDMADL